ncbi:MAG: ABC transporter permease [Candidatus Acetothermia bacterium]|jgi:peptide/nickel transport system permease protein|nr:ABC transporter permease [Candidatus Acetothermia bacterium]
MRRIFQMLRELRRYPSAVGGLALIGLLVAISIYTIIAIPYPEAIRLWRGGPGVWDDNPRNAAPVWTDLFTADRLPRTIVVDNAQGGTKTVEPLPDGRKRIEFALRFDYAYDRFPSEIVLFAQAPAATETPMRTRYSVLWRFPNGQEYQVASSRSMRASESYYISQDLSLVQNLGATGEYALFTDPAMKAVPVKDRAPLKGEYTVVIRAEVPAEADFNAKLVVYGRIHGLAGTDHRRRDLTVALLWGTPLALVFGLVGAVGTTVITFVLSGIGTWFGRWVDTLFQRITQVNMVIPTLPVLIMIGQFYSRSLWLMLAVFMALSIFGGGMVTYRAMFLQAKEAPYIEAARAYGAKNMRIVFRYLLPRIIPVLLPAFVLTVPSFVFLEAGLAVLGLGDPILPTWGKVINDAQSQDALYKGYYYWVVEPALLLMITGFAFSMVGYALDRVFNPRLRTV